MRSDPRVKSAVARSAPAGRGISARDSFSGNERNHLFFGLEGKQFEDVSGLSGLDHPGDSRAFAIFDYDHDGWQDFVVVGANSPLVLLYRNQLGDHSISESAPNRMIGLRFVGSNQSPTPSDGRSNRDGVGTKVELNLGQMKLVREHRAGEGRAAQNNSTMIVGIGLPG